MERMVRGVVRRSMSLARSRPFPREISSSEIRKTFLDFFCETHGHMFVASGPVFSVRDPTLAFVNAGMTQFKDIFLGITRPPSTRVANSQKCVRIGGKHNDLFEVGQDGRHHTFFEMLGNWSFGDYFKREACAMSWELLTQVYEIPPEKLYVTYFSGDNSLGLEPDEEVREIWRELGVNENHIIPRGTNHNFWEGDDTGPCGPCTEIHYDHYPEQRDLASLRNKWQSDLTEIWNLVFMQYNRQEGGTLLKLKKQFVDTGMGFERLVALLQGKTSNYDTDLFLPFFEAIRKYTGHSGYGGKYDGNVIDTSYRVLADHSRMITVTLSDGMIPNHQNKVRKIVRKALLVSQKVFRSDEGLITELTKHAAETLIDAYPEVGRNLPKVQLIIEKEAEKMRRQRTLGSPLWNRLLKQYPQLESIDLEATPQVIRGLQYLENEFLSQRVQNLSGEAAWFLFDSLGIAPELTEELASKLGLTFSMDSFKSYEERIKLTKKKQLNKQLASSRARLPSREVLDQLEERKLEPTVDYFKHDYRVDSSGNYVFDNQPTTVQAIIWKNQLLDELSPAYVEGKGEVGLILDRTQLFAEEGGQACDWGTLTIEKNILFDIRRVIKVQGSVIHFGHFRSFPRDSTVSAHNLGELELDGERRLQTMRNHTALHLVVAALRDCLPVVLENDSYVGPDKLSLDFAFYAFYSKVKVYEHVERFVRDFISHGVPVQRKIFTQQQFQHLDDVTFVPGEPILGNEIPVVEAVSGFSRSREFCTGTHVFNTADIQDFVLFSGKSVSTGMKRVEAVTGEMCEMIREADKQLKKEWHHLQEEVSRRQEMTVDQRTELIYKLKRFEESLSHSQCLPIVTALSLKDEVALAIKTVSSVRRYVRIHVERELRKLLENSTSKFIVHCMELETSGKARPTHFECVSKLAKDIPVLFALRSGDSAAVHSWVPSSFVSDDFSAMTWLVHSLTGCGGICVCDGGNPQVTYFMKQRKLTESQLSRVLQAARNFAEKNAHKIA